MKSVLNKYSKLKLYYVLIGIISVVCSIVLLLATNAMSSLTSYITINGLVNVSHYIYAVLLLFFCYHFISYVVFKKIKSLVQIYLNQNIYSQLSDSLNHRSIDVSYEQGDLYALIQSDASSSITFLSDTFIDIIYQVIRLAMVLVYIFILNVQLSFIYILATIISIFIQKEFSSTVSLANEQAKQKEISMNTILQNILENRLILKMNDADTFAKDLYEDKVLEYTDAYLNVESKALPFRMIGIFLGLLPILSLCVGGIYFIAQGIVSLSTFLSIEYICNCVVYDQLHFSDFITESVKAFVSVKRIVEFETTQEVENNNSTNEILLNDISYHYPNTDKNVLNNITLKVSYGEKIAIVGKSGCGKSTLLKLIAGWIKQDTGSCNLPVVTFVEQFPYLFTDTIKNNITCWKEVDEKEYQHVLSICMINDFLDDDQLILEKNGSNLSGGQKQRIALARAFMNHHNVILFDESFSGIDSNTSLEILQNIMKEYPKETMLFSMHQLELLKQMNRILVMENGSIVFDGNYEMYEAKYGKE